MTNDEEDNNISHKAWLIDKCHELGAVDLDRTRRTIGFERRALRPDQRARTSPAWGIAPRDEQ